MQNKKVYWVLIFISTITLLIAYLTYLTKDIPPFDDSDMQVSPIILKEEENAYFDLLEIEKTIYYPEDKKELIEKMARGEAWDQVFADELIVKNQEALSAFRNILTKKGYQDPAIQEDENTFSPDMALAPISLLQSVAYIEIVQVYKLAKEGSIDLAVSGAIDTAKVGHMIQNSSRETLMGYFVGTRIKQESMNFIQQVIYNAKEGVINLLNEDDYRMLEENSYGLGEAFRSDYWMFRRAHEDIYQELEKGRIEGKASFFYPMLYHPNRTKKALHDFYLDQATVASKSCGYGGEILERYERIAEDKNLVIMFFKGNIIGQVLDKVIFVSTSRIHGTRCEDSFLVLQTQLSLAVNAYRLENGSFPKSLDELVPKYMETVPREFGGKMIEYDSETGRIADMKDFYEETE